MQLSWLLYYDPDNCTKRGYTKKETFCEAVRIVKLYNYNSSSGKLNAAVLLLLLCCSIYVCTTGSRITSGRRWGVSRSGPISWFGRFLLLFDSSQQEDRKTSNDLEPSKGKNSNEMNVIIEFKVGALTVFDGHFGSFLPGPFWQRPPVEAVYTQHDQRS